MDTTDAVGGDARHVLIHFVRNHTFERAGCPGEEISGLEAKRESTWLSLLFLYGIAVI